MNKLNEEILAKFLMGECTEDELREVNAWLEGSGENARELFRLEEIYHLGRLGDTSNTQDIEKAEKRFFFIRLIASRKHYWLSPLMIRLRN